VRRCGPYLCFFNDFKGDRKVKKIRVFHIVLIMFFLSFVVSMVFGKGYPTTDEYVANHESIGDGNELTGTKPIQYVPNEILVKFRRNAATAIEEQLELKRTTNQLVLSQDLDELNARYHVKKIKPIFKNFRTRRQRVISLHQKNKKFLNTREKRILRRLKHAPKNANVPDLDRIYKIQVELRTGQSLEEVVETYQSNPNVEYAELNYIVSMFKTPNDPRYDSPGLWALDKINASEAWDVSTGSPDVIVAVIDSGIDYNHRDLVNNMWTNEVELNGTTGVDDDENGYIDDIYGYDFENDDSNPIDDNGHGTHCAGTIAAIGNNGLDITGVCWNAKIMAIKILGAEGSGTGGLSDVISAFYYAVENGADVTSNSWGGSDAYPQTVQDAINYAYSQGVIMVAAAGNDNTSSPYYPAVFDHMIAVAATNENDQKASFSNYGDWVDIAAPGVDILSLRADGTSLGTPYDSYTTTAEGTSMACPHVAGACALLLSVDPNLTCDEVYNILIDTADPILPGICLSDGRVNLFAMLVAQSRGQIDLDRDYYTCSSVISISLSDTDLEGTGTKEVTLTTSGGDHEIILLAETSPSSGVFTGTISTTTGNVNIFDGLAQIAHNQSIVTIYYDDNDGTGNPTVAMDSALIDCVPPVISNVQAEIHGTGVKITFETDEPTEGQIQYGLTCGGPYTLASNDIELITNHTIRLTDLSEETTYYFVVDATDPAGHQATDDNGGGCYSLTTGTPFIFYVPSKFSTIQAAIDATWDFGGDIVLVADGTYKGAGNRDIDFKGKAITVRSESGPNNCIIDCEGTETNPHHGFYFYNGEGELSILKGFTIINGYVSDYGGGGAINCAGSSPTITNCIISNNWGFRGGGMFNDNSSPTVTNCTFSTNSSDSDGGGMYNYDNSNPMLVNCIFNGNSSTNWSGGGIRNTDYCDPTLIDCTFSGNSANNDGGGMDSENNCDPTLTNCIFSGNTAGRGGGAMRNKSNCNPTLFGCTFSGNLANNSDGGGMLNVTSSPILSNCIFIGNSSTNWSGGGIRNSNSNNPTFIGCIFSGNSANNSGGGISNDVSNAIVINCTFSGNSANGGGGIHNCNSNPEITNSIFWENYAISFGDEIHNYDSNPIITYCDIRNWTDGGTGNINVDPLFMEASNGNYHLQTGSPCVDAGDPDYVMDVNDIDIDGDPRVIGSRVDIGADEYNFSDRFPDLNGDRIVNFYDFTILAYYWMDNQCLQPDWCQGSDLDNSGKVDFNDLAIFSKHWLETPVNFYSCYLDSDPCWSTTGEWAFGHSSGNGGVEHGNPDPSNGYTGTSVYGVNLNGDYNHTITGGPYYLAAGPFDCSLYSNVNLKFARWLNTDESDYVASKIEVSQNSSDWHSVWEHTERPVITDSSWQILEYDISSTADNQETIYIRWSYEIFEDAYPYSGWNIDDIELWGNP